VTYLLRRALLSAVALLGVSVLTFVLLELAPGEFFSDMRLNPQLSPATVVALRAQYGLDQSLPTRYMCWLKSVAKGDWGYSFAYNQPVLPLIWPRAGHTLALTTTALVLTWLLAIPLGAFSASRKNRLADKTTVGTSSVLQAMPHLLFALGFLILALRTGIFPTGGMVSLNYAELGLAAKAKDLFLHSALPVLALVLATLPVFFRHTRASMVDALALPSVRAARAHGIPRKRILLRYALPAAANPLISLLGLSIATLLSESLLIEVVMSWPGLGPMLLESIMARDLYVVIGAVMLSTLFLLMGNFIADVLLYLNDPRLRGSDQ